MCRSCCMITSKAKINVFWIFYLHSLCEDFRQELQKNFFGILEHYVLFSSVMIDLKWQSFKGTWHFNLHKLLSHYREPHELFSTLEQNPLKCSFLLHRLLFLSRQNFKFPARICCWSRFWMYHPMKQHQHHWHGPQPKNWPGSSVCCYYWSCNYHTNSFLVFFFFKTIFFFTQPTFQIFLCIEKMLWGKKGYFGWKGENEFDW